MLDNLLLNYVVVFYYFSRVVKLKDKICNKSLCYF